MNLERNIFDWPVNLNSFSTNEILGWPIKDIFLGFFMILEIDNLLPNELRTIIKKLQKLLYYVQAISLQVFKKIAFKEKIIAWSYGPVVNEIYQKYKENHSNEIKTDEKVKKLSSGLEKVINEVIDSYGSMEANKLIDFTHEEEPWKNTEINKEIKTDIIKEYFNKVYEV